MALKADDLALFLSRFQTGGTEVLAPPFHVAQGAEEAPAMIAGDDGLLLSVVEAARLVIRQCLSRFSGSEAASKGGKNIDPYRHLTGGARDKVRGIIVPARNRRVALGATDLFHGSPLTNNPRITDAVVECPFFFIETRYDIANAKDARAEKVCKEPSEGSCIGDLFAIRSNDLEAASHLTRGGAELTNEIGDVGNVNDKGKEGFENEACQRVPYDEAYQNSQNKSGGIEDDCIDNSGSKADPESAIDHLSRRGDTLPELLHEERFASPAHPSIPESDELVFEIGHPAFTAVARLPRSRIL